MDEKKMHEMLASLRTELGQAGPIDEESRELLRGLMDDIGRLLERPEEQEEDTPRTLSRDGSGSGAKRGGEDAPAHTC